MTAKQVRAILGRKPTGKGKSLPAGFIATWDWEYWFWVDGVGGEGQKECRCDESLGRFVVGGTVVYGSRIGVHFDPDDGLVRGKSFNPGHCPTLGEWLRDWLWSSGILDWLGATWRIWPWLTSLAIH
jgi:hypothetical protein